MPSSGLPISIASGTHVQQLVALGNTRYPSLLILNPNDGVVYVGVDRDVPTTSLPNWDFKIPSQSYARLPGPFQTVGLFYVDQSGAGVAGEIIVYPSFVVLAEPTFQAVGRSLPAVSNTLDITEGVIPPPPATNVVRVFADNSGFLNYELSTGVTTRVADQRLFQAGGLRGYVLAPLLDVRGGVQSSGATPAVNSWATISGTYAATKILATTDLLVFVNYAGFINQGAGAGALNFALSMDGGAAGTGIQDYIGNVWTPASTNTVFYSVSRMMRITGAAVGAHNFRVDVFSQAINSSIFNQGGAGQTFQILVWELYG